MFPRDYPPRPKAQPPDPIVFFRKKDSIHKNMTIRPSLMTHARLCRTPGRLLWLPVAACALWLFLTAGLYRQALHAETTHRIDWSASVLPWPGSCWMCATGTRPTAAVCVRQSYSPPTLAAGRTHHHHRRPHPGAHESRLHERSAADARPNRASASTLSSPGPCGDLADAWKTARASPVRGRPARNLHPAGRRAGPFASAQRAHGPAGLPALPPGQQGRNPRRHQRPAGTPRPT